MVQLVLKFDGNIMNLLAYMEVGCESLFNKLIQQHIELFCAKIFMYDETMKLYVLIYGWSLMDA